MRLAKTSAADMSAALPTEKAAAFAVSGFNVPARRYDAIAFPPAAEPPAPSRTARTPLHPPLGVQWCVGPHLTLRKAACVAALRSKYS